MGRGILARGSSGGGGAGCGGGDGKKVKLCIEGPMYIIRESVTVETTVSRTWKDLLNDELKMGVSDGDGTYLCTSSYNPVRPNRSGAWRAELNDEIGDFVTKFKRAHNKFIVRIRKDAAITRSKRRRGKRAPSVKRVISTSGRPVTKTRRTPVKTPMRAGSKPIQLGTSTGPLSPRQVVARRIPVVVLTRPPPTFAMKSTPDQNGSRSAMAINEVASTVRPVVSIEIPSTSGSASVPAPAAPTPAPTLTRVVVKESPDSAAILPNGPALQAPKVKVVSWMTVVGENNVVVGDEAEADAAQGQSGCDWNIEEMEELRSVSDVEEEEDFFDCAEEISQVSTAINEQGDDLKAKGIDDITKFAAESFAKNFDNPYMLKMQKEMNTLKDKGSWINLVSRSPLACYLIQELLK